ncbi:hypothetical protein [Ferrovum myxofaciens]|uniref:hypothetical protein n=1 Tax=Ferrovum myxofaciens TaxID=416213 RepID=UPI002354FA62|nr:hypothetical protein [Ferrovum myxofaciens]MBU6993497.1 hypothetical protein [Ferrovum myxofaciens]
MNLSVWKDDAIVANILGTFSPSPTDEYPEQYRSVLNRLISADDHYEIYLSNGSGRHMHIEGLTCWIENGDIVFTFIETGYV